MFTMNSQNQRKLKLLKILSKLLECPLISFFFDPLGAKLISLYLTQILNKWKLEGKLENYKVTVQRVDFLCYKINLRVFMKKQETRKIILNIIKKIIKLTLTT